MNNFEPTMNSTEEYVQANEAQETPKQNDESASHEPQACEFSKELESEAKAIHEQEPQEFSLNEKTFSAFMEELKSKPDPEKKLEFAINFMKETLSQKGTPHFKEFWQARRVCLDLFKENIAPPIRMALWTAYSELCRQARNLKEIFDEQSAFAVEQIEMAISSIESEAAYFPELLQKLPDMSFDIQCQAIQERYDAYNRLQRELNLLNTYAVKTNALRKELIKTEMRIRTKNKFFERLSKIGDAIFPRRKALIQEVSHLFVEDVNRFIEKTFVHEMKTQELFSVRDEIKALQAVAKQLTLNTEAFSQSRLSLSECWDSVKSILKERRKATSEKAQVFKENKEKLIAEIQELKTSYEEKKESAKACEKKLDDMVHAMRKIELGKTEIREIRELAKEFRQTLLKEMHAQDEQRRHEIKKKDDDQKQKFTTLRDSLKELLASCDQKSFDELQQLYEEQIVDAAKTVLTKGQKQEIEAYFRRIKDTVSDKKEHALLSDDQKQALDGLEEVLKERLERRKEIKEEIESLRKLQGSSGLDFTEALHYNELMETQKERLEHLEAGIREIEEKIDEI